MPSALLMQQSGPQVGPQGQSKTVTVTITGTCGAHHTRRVVKASPCSALARLPCVFLT